MNDRQPLENTYILEIEQYRERLRIALKSAKICVFEVDIVNQLYTFFENAEDIFGVSGEAILKDVQAFSKLSPDEYRAAVSQYFSHPDDVEIIGKAFLSIFDKKPTTYEARMRAGGSGYVWCKIDVAPIVEDGKAVKMVGVITDITNMKARTDKLERAVQQDNFTGLYNKQSAVDLIQETLQKNPDQMHALALLDIDNFKMLNDTYGHVEGDKVILSIANVLKRNFRKSDILGRFGGDEFIFFIQDIPSLDWLKNKLCQLIQYKEERYGYTNSIGVAVFPQDAKDFNKLMSCADKALYHSKLSRAGYTFFFHCKAK